MVETDFSGAVCVRLLKLSVVTQVHDVINPTDFTIRPVRQRLHEHVRIAVGLCGPSPRSRRGGLGLTSTDGESHFCKDFFD